MLKKELDRNYYKINDIVSYRSKDIIKSGCISSIGMYNKFESYYKINDDIVLDSDIIRKDGYKYKIGDRVKFISAGKEIIGRILYINFITSPINNGAIINVNGEYTSRRFYVIGSGEAKFNVQDDDIINIVA